MASTVLQATRTSLFIGCIFFAIGCGASSEANRSTSPTNDPLLSSDLASNVTRDTRPFVQRCEALRVSRSPVSRPRDAFMRFVAQAARQKGERLLTCARAYDYVSGLSAFNGGPATLAEPFLFFPNLKRLSIHVSAMSPQQFALLARLPLARLEVHGNTRGFPCPFQDANICVNVP